MIVKLRSAHTSGLTSIYSTCYPCSTLLSRYTRLLWLVLCHCAQTQEAENMIEKMEQDEDVLIERLKKIQEEQRRAYELLQESLES